MTTLYIATYDCRGKVKLRREDFAGDRYPNNPAHVTGRWLIACRRLMHTRCQRNQWHGGTDEEAVARARRLAAEYMAVPG